MNSTRKKRKERKKKKKEKKKRKKEEKGIELLAFNETRKAIFCTFPDF